MGWLLFREPWGFYSRATFWTASFNQNICPIQFQFNFLMIFFTGPSCVILTSSSLVNFTLIAQTSVRKALQPWVNTSVVCQDFKAYKSVTYVRFEHSDFPFLGHWRWAESLFKDGKCSFCFISLVLNEFWDASRLYDYRFQVRIWCGSFESVVIWVRSSS